MHIREAHRSDVPAIVALLADDDLGRQRERPSEPLPDSYWEAFEAIAADPNNLLVVLEEGDEILGTLQLTFIPYLTFQGGRRALIEAVRVTSDRRGQQLGRRLIEWAIDTAKEHGCHMVQLTTNKVRKDAHRFYSSLGFEATHEGFKLTLDPDG